MLEYKTVNIIGKTKMKKKNETKKKKTHQKNIFRLKYYTAIHKNKILSPQSNHVCSGRTNICTMREMYCVRQSAPAPVTFVPSTCLEHCSKSAQHKPCHVLSLGTMICHRLTNCVLLHC